MLINMNISTHAEFKKECLKNKTTMTDVVNKAIKKYIKKGKKNGN